jgi:signal transduction histidine kinase
MQPKHRKGRKRQPFNVSTAVESHEGDQLKFIVSDNGDGIPEENLPQIFNPFFTTKGEGKGVGLGLAVVFGIIEAHKGDIDVKSVLSEGTTFTVTLPFDETAPSAEPANTQPGTNP